MLTAIKKSLSAQYKVQSWINGWDGQAFQELLKAIIKSKIASFSKFNFLIALKLNIKDGQFYKETKKIGYFKKLEMENFEQHAKKICSKKSLVIEEWMDGWMGG